MKTLEISMPVGSMEEWTDANEKLRAFRIEFDIEEIGAGTGFGFRDMSFEIPSDINSDTLLQRAKDYFDAHKIECNVWTNEFEDD